MEITSIFKRDSGVTALEALIAVFILTILVQLALPRYEQLVTDHQGRQVLQRLAGSIYLARASSARWGSSAVLCPSTSGQSCSGDWHDGVLVFLDRNDNQAPDNNEEILDYLDFERLPGTLHWRAFRSKPFLQITPLGFTRYQNGNFTWCDRRKTPGSARQLILNRTGRVRFAKDSDGDGLRENSRGDPVRCPG